jgi:hypothetical protein
MYYMKTQFGLVLGFEDFDFTLSSPLSHDSMLCFTLFQTPEPNFPLAVLLQPLRPKHRPFKAVIRALRLSPLRLTVAFAAQG